MGKGRLKVAAKDEELELPALEGMDEPAPEPAPEGGEAVEGQEKGEGQQAQEVTGDKVTAGTPAVEVLNAPNTWRGEAKGEWTKLPRFVQEEVLKREKDIHEGLSSNKQHAEVGQSFTQAITPYLPLMRAAGEDPIQAAVGLFQAAYELRTDPYRKMAELMQIYRVDPMQLLARMGINAQQPNAQGQPPAMDPMIRQVLERQSGMEAHLQNWEAQRQAADAAEADRQLAQFGANPKNEHFNDPQVKQHMGRLLKAGIAAGLDDAYDQACKLVPHVWAEVMKRTDAERALQTRQKAANAKRASVEVVDEGNDPFPKDGTEDLATQLRRNYRKYSTG